MCLAPSDTNCAQRREQQNKTEQSRRQSTVSCASEARNRARRRAEALGQAFRATRHACARAPATAGITVAQETFVHSRTPSCTAISSRFWKPRLRVRGQARQGRSGPTCSQLRALTRQGQRQGSRDVRRWKEEVTANQGELLREGRASLSYTNKL